MNADKFKIHLGQIIRKKRLSMGYSQEGFADVVGIHRTYQGAVERGERNLSIVNMLKIASALKIMLSTLIEETESSM